ncbi:MAG TPA: 50S ribosomal protein L11 methyltransferase [Burkholderiales bacterium]|jgi:ribosomal protein L11 methyltransferase
MSWLSVSFEVPAERVEALSDALLEAGAVSVDIADADAGTGAEEAVFADAALASRPWKHSVVSALLARGMDAAAVVEAACACAGVAAPEWRVREVADEDWVRASREQLAPVRISPRLWIVPSWHQAPDPDAVAIVLDPGLAFGTGHHPSTRMCLRWLERVIRGGESVLDFGCGSGILAIAAMKLGAVRADGVDIDEQALLAARRNAMHNRVQVTFHGAADALRQPARIVVANILAHPLIVLAPLLARLTAQGGRLALAGLLAAQAAGVRAAYAPWFDFEAPEEDEGWALVSGVCR